MIVMVVRLDGAVRCYYDEWPFDVIVPGGIARARPLYAIMAPSGYTVLEVDVDAFL